MTYQERDTTRYEPFDEYMSRAGLHLDTSSERDSSVMKEINRLRSSLYDTDKLFAELTDLQRRWGGKNMNEGHGDRVGLTTRAFLYYLQGKGCISICTEDIEMIGKAADVHDVGKIFTKLEVVDKPTSLSAAEWQEMQNHSVLSGYVLDYLGFPQQVVDVGFYHHERYDGKGYPSGLTGDEIPLASQIVALSDCTDAMRMNRPYHAGIDPYVILERLTVERGQQFNPVLVDMFIEAYCSGIFEEVYPEDANYIRVQTAGA